MQPKGGTRTRTFGHGQTPSVHLPQRQRSHLSGGSRVGLDLGDKAAPLPRRSRLLRSLRSCPHPRPSWGEVPARRSIPLSRSEWRLCRPPGLGSGSRLGFDPYVTSSTVRSSHSQYPLVESDTQQVDDSGDDVSPGDGRQQSLLCDGLNQISGHDHRSDHPHGGQARSTCPENSALVVLPDMLGGDKPDRKNEGRGHDDVQLEHPGLERMIHDSPGSDRFHHPVHDEVNRTRSSGESGRDPQ